MSLTLIVLGLGTDVLVNLTGVSHYYLGKSLLVICVRDSEQLVDATLHVIL